MFKLFRRKLNKKGFTLAELLVVVAIIAILIAIAIPIFTGAMEEAQLRTNQGNMRAVKAAGTTEILTHWGKYNTTSTDGTGDAATWWEITARVDRSGKIDKLAVKAYKEKPTGSSGEGEDGITIGKESDTPTAYTTGDNVKKVAANETNPYYFVRVYTTDVEPATT